MKSLYSSFFFVFIFFPQIAFSQFRTPRMTEAPKRISPPPLAPRFAPKAPRLFNQQYLLEESIEGNFAFSAMSFGMDPISGVGLDIFSLVPSSFPQLIEGPSVLLPDGGISSIFLHSVNAEQSRAFSQRLADPDPYIPSLPRASKKPSGIFSWDTLAWSDSQTGSWEETRKKLAEERLTEESFEQEILRQEERVSSESGEFVPTRIVPSMPSWSVSSFEEETVVAETNLRWHLEQLKPRDWLSLFRFLKSSGIESQSGCDMFLNDLTYTLHLETLEPEERRLLPPTKAVQLRPDEFLLSIKKLAHIIRNKDVSKMLTFIEQLRKGFNLSSLNKQHPDIQRCLHFFKELSRHIVSMP